MHDRDAWTINRNDLWAFGLLLVVVIVVFRSVIAGTHDPVMSSLKDFQPWKSELTLSEISEPESFAQDPTTQTYPWAVYAHENLVRGDFPLWNTRMFSGTPFVANRLTGLFDPLILIPVWLFEPMTGLAIFYFIHYLLAAWFFYLFLKSIGLSRPAAVFGAVSFILQGVYVPWMGFIVADKCYLPMSLYYLERSCSRRDRTGVVGFLVSFTLLTITSYPQMIVFAFYIFTGWVLFSKGPGAGKAAKRAAAFGIMLVTVILLGAVQHVPMLEFFRNSLRAYPEFAEELASKTRLEQHDSPLTLIAIFFPTFFGDYINDPLPGEAGFIAGIYNHAYIGILAAFGFLLAPTVWKNRAARFFTVVSVIGLVFIASNPIYMFAVKIIPGLRISTVKPDFVTLTSMIIVSSFVLDHLLKNLRVNENFASRFNRYYGWLLGAVIGLGVVLILSRTISGYFDPEGTARIRIIFGHFVIVWIAGALMYFYNRGRLKINLAVGGILLILLLDLIPYHDHFMPLVKKGRVCFKTGLSNYLEEKMARDGPFRIFRNRKEVFPPNTPMLYGLDEIGGFDSFMSADYSFFFRSVDPSDETGKRVMSTNSRTLDLPSEHILYNQPFWSFLGIRYLLSTQPMAFLGTSWLEIPPEAHYSPGRSGLQELRDDSGNNVYVYENTQWLPRWFLVNEILPIETVEQGYETAQWFDPASEAVVMGIEHSDIPPDLIDGNAVRYSEVGTVELVEYSPDELRLKVTSDRDAFLVFSDTYFPGWKAKIEGVETEIYRTDGVIKGIVLNSGSHDVRFIYDPASYKIGWALFFIGLVLAPFILNPVILLMGGSGAKSDS